MRLCGDFSAIGACSASIWVLLLSLTVNGVHAQESLPRPAAGIPRLKLSAAASEELPPSDAEHPPRRWHTGYLIFGASMLVSGYLASVALGELITGSNTYECRYESSKSCDNARPLFIPLIGPALAQTDYPAAIPALLMLTQFVGLTFTVLGLVLDPDQGSPSGPRRVGPPVVQGMRLRLAAVPLSGGGALTTQISF
jgi:hypothetical protein